MVRPVGPRSGANVLVAARLGSQRATIAAGTTTPLQNAAHAARVMAFSLPAHPSPGMGMSASAPADAAALALVLSDRAECPTSPAASATESATTNSRCTSPHRML